MRAEDLLAAVFPAQVACQDNRAGPVEIPDHPLVRQTMQDCLHEAMDLEGLRQVLTGIESGSIRTLALDTVAPSPASHEILNANPYAFLDDAPLEERRARAVSLRRTDPDLARGIGALDPEVVQQVRAQAWPEVRDPGELHDALLQLTLIPSEELGSWGEHLPSLLQSGRAARVSWPAAAEAPQEGEVADGQIRHGVEPLRRGVVAAERISRLLQALPQARMEPELKPPPLGPSEVELLEQVRGMTALVQGWMECTGPTTSRALAERLGLEERELHGALLQLETEGQVLRGHFGGEASALELEWCDRRLLARMHRMTIGKLRREIQSGSPADFIRYLLHWQWVQPGTQLSGSEGLLRIIRQLQGLELPAPAWEREVLPARLTDYRPSDLEALCLSGQVVWGRLSPRTAMRPDEEEPRPRRLAPPTRSAPIGFALREDLPNLLEPWESRVVVRGNLSGLAHEVLRFLEREGASFQDDIQRGTGQLPTQVEEGLWELAASGLVTADGLADLRSLLLPARQRDQARRRWGRAGDSLRGLVGPRGRWALLGKNFGEARVEAFASQLLQRYGVIVRELLAREAQAPPWRELVRVYRSMEARGEIRGGRFVDGLVGEQYALPEAVDLLRRVRRLSGEPERLVVSAADPLNLVGILTPGRRVSPLSGLYILYENGVPTAADELGALRRHELALSAAAAG
jgi:ATP-dependent Lhr-like helicase